MNVNIGNIEAAIRTIVALGVIAMVQLFAQMPPWLALAATYPFFTALFKWDPAYALINALSFRQDRHAPRSGAAHGVSA